MTARRILHKHTHVHKHTHIKTAALDHTMQHFIIIWWNSVKHVSILKHGIKIITAEEINFDDKNLNVYDCCDFAMTLIKENNLR